MTLQELLAGIQGWNPDVQRMGVRPGYGLQGALVQAQAKSPYERTLQPGERRSADQLRDMLSEVILAGGSGAVPVIQGRAASRRPPGMRAISQTHTGDLSIRQLRGDLKGGSLEWTPVPTSKPWLIRFPDGTVLKGFEDAEKATAWMAKNKIEF